MSFNTNTTMLDIENSETGFLTKIDETKPAGALCWYVINDFIYPYCEMAYFSDDLTNSIIKITN